MRVAKVWPRDKFVRQVVLFSALGLVLLAARPVFAQNASAGSWGQLTPTEIRDRLSDDPFAGAAVVFDQGLITVGPGFRFTYERHRRVQIFRADAYRFANVEIPHHVSERLEKIEAHTLTPEGKVIEVASNEIFESKIGDRVASVFAFPGVVPGCVVEYRYTLTSDNFYYLRPWIFQNDVPTEYSELSVRVPEGFEYEAVLNNTDFVHGPDSSLFPSVRFDVKVRQFTWWSRKLAPLFREPCVASIFDHQVQLDFQIVRFRDGQKIWEFVDSWPDLANQVKRVYKPLLRHGDTWQKMGRIPEGIPAAQKDIARRTLLNRIYQSVRDSVASTEGTGSIAGPEIVPVAEVLAQRRGTPIEKNLLLVSLLRYNGFSAHPFLISRRNHIRFDRRDHRLDQFDHVLVLLDDDGEKIFCDANSPAAWLGYLPPEDQVGAGVVIDAPEYEDSVVLEVPAPPVNSESKGAATIELYSDGSATGQLNASVSGEAAYELLRALADRDTVGYLQRQWLPEIAPRSFSVSVDANNEWAPIKFTVDFNWAQAATLDDQRLFLRPAILRRLGSNPLMTSTRRYPVSFDVPWTEDCQITWKLPDGFALHDLPEGREMTGDGFVFRSAVGLDKDHVVATRFWRVDKRDFPLIRFPELRELFNTVQLSERALVVLYKD
ncbi:MAG: DUF3857 domain-containing protein [candidate division Zixibacteria bacterium]|nr:DUF3857 domain-containing protein [candidate division Zixibacteria bacterium]